MEGDEEVPAELNWGHQGDIPRLQGLHHRSLLYIVANVPQLVNADNVVVATFEKDRWCSFRRSEKCEGTPNKKKTYTGTLRIYAPSHPAPAFDPPSSGPGGAANAGEEKETKNLNLRGPHSGDLTEEAIAFTCWIAVEAEHRLRYKIFDLLEEVGESAGG